MAYMDYQNRVGHKLGSGAPATWQVRFVMER